jgi:hypothetical protein
MPPNVPARIRDQAKLQDLIWVAEQLVACHDRYVRRTSKFSECLCSLCRHARPWVSADSAERNLETSSNEASA